MTRPGPEFTADAEVQIDWQQELKRNDRWLRAVIYSRLRDLHAVDEVAQEVALAAVRQQAPIADPTRTTGWLYRLAVTQSLLYRRKMGRRRKLVDRYVDRVPGTMEDRHDADPLHWMLSEERRALVRQAMSALPARDAEILMLKHTQNFSYLQLADLLGISHSAVESRLHRARGRLRTELAALQISEVEG